MNLRTLVLSCLALSTVGPSPLSAQTVSEVFQRVNDAVAVILTRERSPDPGTETGFTSVGGLGSGVLVARDTILTAAHVVQTADTIVVRFPTGEFVEATVVTSEPAADLAVLHLEHPPSGVLPARIGNSDSVVVGEQIFIIGAPMGLTHTLTVGHISARRRPNQTVGGLFRAEFLQTDAAINVGNSGGPMFNLDGEVIGIVSNIISRSGGFEGLGFAVTSNLAVELMRGMPLWSGVDGYRLTGDFARIFNVPEPGTGLLVQRVARGSLGEVLGLRGGTMTATIGDEKLIIGGDIVLTFQEIPIGDVDQYDRMIQAADRLRPGDFIRIVVLREGEQLLLTTTYDPFMSQRRR